MDAAQNMSEEQLLQEFNLDFRMTVLPVTVLFGVEALFGTIGNLLTLYVFFFHYKSCNFRYFVLCLAMIDLSGCLTSILGEMISQLFWFDYPWELLAVCKIKDFFNQFTICAEAGLLVVIAVDRYRKVCEPFGWQIKENKAKLLCVIIYAIAAVLATPAPILWGMHSETKEYKGRNITITLCERDEKYRNTKLILANIVLNHSLIFVTMVCMVVMYVLVARKLIIGQHLIKKRTEHLPTPNETANESSTDVPSNDTSNKVLRMESNNPSEDDASLGNAEQNRYNRKTNELQKLIKVRRKTVIMLYLTAIFVITTLIYSSLIACVASGVLADISGAGKAVYLLFLRFYFINHVVNPVLYGIMDKQFRLEMKKIRSNFRRVFSKKK